MSSKGRPIIFSSPMVCAVLADKKTQTRRIVKPQAAVLTDEMARALGVQPPANQNPPVIPCPYGVPGDRLWVRETWAARFEYDGCSPLEIHQGTPIWYRSDELGDSHSPDQSGGIGKWRPSIHMPHWVSRITLEITDVRVQHLTEISEEDALAEGIEFAPDYAVRAMAHIGLEEGDWIPNAPPVPSFQSLWASIHGPGSWDANPWVWAITFKKLETAS